MLKAQSYARITLALDIIKKLEKGEYTGYHELHIVKHPIELSDEVRVEESSDFRIQCDNPEIPVNENNICWKVVKLLEKEFGLKKNVSSSALNNNDTTSNLLNSVSSGGYSENQKQRNIKISLRKKIPPMGGLAGGSSNAATVFKLLNTFWNLNMSQEEMIVLSRKIGMDVPFYFLEKTAFDTEATGILEKIETDLKFLLVLVFPHEGIFTKQAYQEIDYRFIGKNTDKTKKLIQALKENNPQEVARNLHNDFEISVFKKHPALQKIKNDLLQAGCTRSVLSGSGSTIVGIIPNDQVLQILRRTLKYKYLITKSRIG